MFASVEVLFMFPSDFRNLSGRGINVQLLSTRGKFLEAELICAAFIE